MSPTFASPLGSTSVKFGLGNRVDICRFFYFLMYVRVLLWLSSVPLRWIDRIIGGLADYRLGCCCGSFFNFFTRFFPGISVVSSFLVDKFNSLFIL